MPVTAEVDRKVERDMAEEAHRRGNVGDLEREPGLPIAHDDIGVDQRRLDIERQRLALRLRQFRHQIRNHHVKTGKHGVFCRHAMRCAGIDIADADAVAALSYIDDRRLQTKAHVVVGTIKRAVIEAGEYDVIHCAAGRGSRNERAH